MDQTITIKDIARKTGFSTATVSRVLNNQELVKKKTKDKVLKVIKDLNYQPNLLAKSFKMKKTFSIGVIIPDISDAFFPEVLGGIENVLHKHGYNIILCHSKEDHEREQKEIEMLLSKRVDGLIMFPSAPVNDCRYYDALINRNVKFVLLGRYFPQANFDYIITDDERGSYDMTKFLINSGYKNIGIITGPLQVSSSMKRLKGYKKALKDNGIKESSKMIQEGGFYEEDGYEAMNKFIIQENIPDVVFASNDSAAIGAMRAIKKKGLEIPKDIGIVGYGDMKHDDMLDPALTTVYQPKFKMGSEAATMLIDKLENKENMNHQVKLDCKLVIRNSTQL